MPRPLIGSTFPHTMANVFLSYDREDADSARAVADALERAGHSVWWDRHIKGGAQYSKAIEQALDAAEVVVVLWSRHAAESAWVRDEAAAGRDSGRLVPATLDGSSAPLGFRQYQTIDLAEGRLHAASIGMQALLEAVAEARPGETNLQRGGSAPTGSIPGFPKSLLTRRNVAAGLIATAAIGGAGYFALRNREDAPPPPAVAALLAQAWAAWTQGSTEGYDQAIGLYLRATELAPGYADAWCMLAWAYADRAQFFASAQEQPALRERAREAAGRALQLDSRNAYANAAIAYAQPLRGNWLAMERAFRQANEEQPGKSLIVFTLAFLMMQVGRLSEGADLFGQLRGDAPTANQFRWHILALWGSGRLGEAEALMAEASRIFGARPAIWFLRFDMLTASGRPEAAIAFAQDSSARPAAVSTEELNAKLVLARAIAGRDQQAVGTATETLLQGARQSTFRAYHAIPELSALGRVDDAFSVAQAYFFSRGFAIPDAPGEPARVTLAMRYTMTLFLPFARAMRADPRFGTLMEQIGLARYWREANAQPDYRRG